MEWADNDPIYLDYLASTPVDPRVSAVMMKYLSTHFGNPTSKHFYGEEPKRAIEEARRRIAELINCSSENIIFTSGGSESNTFAICGGLKKIKELFPGRNHIITSKIEHPAVMKTIDNLTEDGYEVTKINVDDTGRILLDELKKEIKPDKTAMISIMFANNEIGTIQPIQEIVELCKENNIIFHSDAAQAIGKIPIDVQELGVDMLSIAGHKFYGPKGVGALYCKGSFRPKALILGACQEVGLRSGTENVHSIVGLGKAAEIAFEEFQKNHHIDIKNMRDSFENKLLELFPNSKVNGNIEHRLPMAISLSIPDIRGFDLMLHLGNNVCFSAGAACSTGKGSATLSAINLDPELAKGTIRISLGRFTTQSQLDKALLLLENGVKELKEKASQE